MLDKPDAATEGDAIVERTHAAGITTLTLNRPAVRNCLSEAMIAEIHNAMVELAGDNDTRVIVLAANGPVFSSGHDLKEMTARRADKDAGRAYFEGVMASCSAMMQSIIRCPKPVIAQVQGTASAAGVQLIASCDLAVTVKHARFSTPGVHIGLFCSTPMVALSRNTARKHAMEMLLTGKMVSAKTAKRFGLVNKVVKPENLENTTRQLAATVASKSMKTVAIGKEAFYRQAELPLADAYDYAAKVMVDNMMARDAEEGIGAFIEKRPPNWQDD